MVNANDHVWISPHPLELPDEATGAGITVTTNQLQTALQTALDYGAETVQLHVRRDGGRMKLYLLAPGSATNPRDAEVTDAFKIAPYGGYE